ncbi:hypothetical protein FISHEDRAFT_8792, partial [Fistulina hepatica ATCC 64428]
DFAIGILLLLVVVFLWTLSNFITQGMFEGGYEKPFLVTYLNTSAFSLYLMPLVVKRVVKNYRRHLSEQVPFTKPDQITFTHPEPHVVQNDLPPLTTQETAKLAIHFCFLWFAANWSVNASLDYTSVASVTILSSMSGFFTLGIGRIFNVEVLTRRKVLAVIVSFCGVCLVSYSDSSETQNVNHSELLSRRNTLLVGPIFGDLLALFSAVFYALYVLLLKIRIKSESRVDMQLFFGFVGLCNIIGLWPIAIILHYLGIETLELPGTRSDWIVLLVNMAITWASDYIYVLAMLKTTPMVVTVGLSLTIPVAVVGDFLLAKPVSGRVIIGAALVLAAFCALGVDSPKIELE